MTSLSSLMKQEKLTKPSNLDRIIWFLVIYAIVAVSTLFILGAINANEVRVIERYEACSGSKSIIMKPSFLGQRPDTVCNEVAEFKLRTGPKLKKST